MQDMEIGVGQDHFNTHNGFWEESNLFDSKRQSTVDSPAKGESNYQLYADGARDGVSRF